MRPARTIAVVVFAAAVAITGCSTNPTANNPAAAPPATSQPAAASPAPTPTAPRPRATQPTPPPTSHQPTGPIACRTSQLHLRTGLTDGATGRQWTTYVFQNRSALDCTLSGFPTVRLLDPSRREIASLPSHDAATNPVVRLRPGGSAYFSVGQPSGPEYPGQPCPAAATLIVTPPHQGQALRIPTTLAPCGGRLWGAVIRATY
jgi:Protein of unknown function (DUF4232)